MDSLKEELVDNEGLEIHDIEESKSIPENVFGDQPIVLQTVKIVECSKCGLGFMEDLVASHEESCSGPSDIPASGAVSFNVTVEEVENFDEDNTENVALNDNEEADADFNADQEVSQLTIKDEPGALCFCCDEVIGIAHKAGRFKCEECNFQFVQKASLHRHKRVAHGSPGAALHCPECSARCYSETELRRHMFEHHKSSKPYHCSSCHTAFSRKYHVARHMKYCGCDGRVKPSFPCNVCGKVFTRQDNLREHLRAHAGQVKRTKIFKCDTCQKEFHGHSLLQIHVRTHTGERPYPCDLCPKAFPSSGAMKKHRRVHTGEKPYKCDQCEARFAAKETLNRHIRTHTNDKPHVCQFCGRRFIQATQLRAHMFHHTGENAFKCDYCGKAFNRRTRLVTHVQFLHEGATPFECPECPKQFFRKEDLSRHSVLHSGVKAFACPTCNKSFAMKSSLTVHLLTHRREPPQKCDECGRAFIRQDCLIRHMRSKHRDMLEDIVCNAEKRRLQEQLLAAAATKSSNVTNSIVWTELTLTDSIKELLSILVDESTLKTFGWPDTPVDKVLDSVIMRCGHTPASNLKFDYIDRLRENAKLLFTAVIDDTAVKTLLNNQTVDEVILHVLRLARSE